MATTTSFLQKYPDYFDTSEDCISFSKNYNKIQSNPRYRNFYQTQFTCGDEEQFQKYRYDKNNKDEIKVEDISINDNLFFEKKLFTEWEKYKKLDGLSTINTFRYIFKKFKEPIYFLKGCFVSRLQAHTLLYVFVHTLISPPHWDNSECSSSVSYSAMPVQRIKCCTRE